MEIINHKKKLKDTLVAYAFMAPALIILIVFVFYPIVYSIPLAFYDYSIMGDAKFIGMDNFVRLFADGDFWIALKNSCLFVIVVPILQLLSIAIAMLMNQKLKGTTFFRVLFYTPVVTSMVAVSIIWKYIFDPDGIINGLLMQWHLISSPIQFLFDTNLALPTLMAVTIWQGLGYYMMLYLAGLQSVPEELPEAATIDGANGWQCFWRIRLPLLQPYIWFCSLISVIAALGVFDVVFTMTDGGPDKSTYVINYYSYRQAFMNFDFGYSAAIGLVLGIVTTIFSIVQFTYGKKGGGNLYD